MTRTLARLGVVLSVLAGAFIVLVLSSPLAVAKDHGAKPPDPYPPALQKLYDEGTGPMGISKTTGEYCDPLVGDPDCRLPDPDNCHEYPAGMVSCVGEGSYDKDEAHQYDVDQYKHWQKIADPQQPHYKEIDAYLKKCVVTEKKDWQTCWQQAGDKFTPGIGDSLVSWVGGKISKLASNALQEIAEALGHSVVWLLKQFADAFNSISTIQLGKTGIAPVLGITTGLSALVAAFLLLVQWGKVAVSQQAGPAVTAITGLAKWGAILAVYLVATQTALTWSDTLSTALINNTFAGGGTTSKDATAAMQQQLGELFSGLLGTGGGAAATSALITGSGVTGAAVGVVIVISILCILAIGALWIEMLMRQAGIMILVVMMPLALAGQMADASKEWWPKARNALISLILMKPVIVICFSIGFSSMAGATGMRNILVGLLIFIIAGFAWPVIARFMTITTVGAGAGMASGVMSSVASSMSSMFGGYQPALGGAGAMGGGAAYTKALENESSGGGGDGGAESAGASGGKGGFFKGRSGGSFMGQVGATIGLGLQVAAVGKDMAESGLSNAAGHAGLDSANPGGRHVVVAPRNGRSRDSGGPTPTSMPEEQDPGPSPEPAAAPTPSEGS